MSNKVSLLVKMDITALSRWECTV